jgi:antibiotic biosynthesis monooxygenase (ABM) superfamily enzyme
MDQASSAPIHVAITRRIKPGRGAEFQQALNEFFKTSFAHTGVQGAAMLTPPPGSDSNEYGIIRTFENENERKSFYESRQFLEWKEKVAPLTEGEATYRELHGLEAFFRSQTQPVPPRWKMAVATYCGVVPVTLFTTLTVGRLLQGENLLVGNLIANACVVFLLTWVVMPLVTRILKRWLK